MSEQTTPSLQAPIKGSWEELLLRAQQMISQQNDDAIPLLERIIDRLAAVPPAQRQAGQQRLEQILHVATTDLIFYLTYRDRFDEAMAAIDRIAPAVAEERRVHWQRHHAAIRLQSGAVDEGLADLRSLAAAGDIDDWGDFFLTALRFDRLDTAAEALDQAEHTLNRMVQAGLGDEEAKAQRAQIAYLRARYALATDNVAESLAWTEHAMASDRFFANNPAFFYTHLVENGHYAEALGLTRRDQANPIRAGFWSGLAMQRMGRSAEAERQWRQLLRAPLPEDERIDIFEYILAHYYLGDREGRGLALALDTIREQDDAAYGLFFLAGLGWALRGDMTAAHANLRLALMRSKATAIGRHLPRQWWPFCTDLVQPSPLHALATYFGVAPEAQP
ncbi:MAG: hypothetical protein M9936_12490 [Caldilinea sp.]|nr:hypothetical protein [Caldilinea sp.]MCB0067467.1 hypothetical protein [Caldilineaceae bacterium]MCB9114639.1 hypothetical protein [Caldilineaceae bacterium]MCB9120245.1 hypothetical protein [Caldilineaceae bacterium]MCB9124077.1 hypothetical protein [Caldilineaceae bacterium]